MERISSRCGFRRETSNETDAAIMRVAVGEDTRMVLHKLPLIETLRKPPLFSGLTESELQALSNCTVVRSCGVGEILLSEGEPCAGLYVVVTGRVRIFKLSSSGRGQVLAIEGPGASIAELPVFDGGAYPASVTAIESSELLFISQKDFRSFCLQHPEVALKVLKVVGARLRRLVAIIEELSFTTVRHRLISWILRQAHTEGFTFALGTSHQDLACPDRHCPRARFPQPGTFAGPGIHCHQWA